MQTPSSGSGPWMCSARSSVESRAKLTDLIPSHVPDATLVAVTRSAYLPAATRLTLSGGSFSYPANLADDELGAGSDAVTEREFPAVRVVAQVAHHELIRRPLGEIPARQHPLVR